MEKLTRAHLWSLEEYATERAAFRAAVMAHKKRRRVSLGAHATLLFEDFLTMKYQVQEMLRVERIFEPAAIEAEIAAYNPLIPDGRNWKATLMIEFEDAEERAAALARMPDLEYYIWVEVIGGPRLRVFANDDLERPPRDKTAAVHFLRFEFDDRDIAAMRMGAPVTMGIDHPEMPCETTLCTETVASLLGDLEI